ncbi:MAG: gliding motility lipoprotein GldH [Bacteroidales bacterium]|nr:gliding motility lipoprotein GldH [Bacteroidales bacterium]
MSCIVSCNQGEVYYKFTPIPKNEWSKNQEYCFLLDSLSVSSTGNYAISVEVLHNISYQYKNLSLLLEQSVGDSTLLKDTLECILVDSDGRWIGSGNGATRQLSVLYKTNFKIDTTLHNKICVRHTMQDLKLKGIEKVGLKVY